jgi:hypothetical protein
MEARGFAGVEDNMEVTLEGEGDGEKRGGMDEKVARG